MDGFPKSYENAKGVFLMPEKQGDEDGGGDEENKPMILNPHISPQHVIILNADDEFLIKRVANLTEDEVKGTHYNQKDMARRLSFYRNLNQTGRGKMNALIISRHPNPHRFLQRVKNRHPQSQCRECLEQDLQPMLVFH